MDQTTWVIQVLDDSKNKSIEYQNRFWLRQNVKKMKISACVEDCIVNIFNVVIKWTCNNAIIIQNGKSIQFEDEFHPEKEALLLVDRKGGGFWVFLYSPQE